MAKDTRTPTECGRARGGIVEIECDGVRWTGPGMAEVDIHPKIAEDEQYVMRRLHDIVSGSFSDDGPFRNDMMKSDVKWQLDGSNDWWARLRGTTLVLSTRYNYEKLKALAVFARFAFQ